MSIRILVAGGCHVVGYPIGEDHSFVNVMTERLDDLGIGAEAETLAYLPATHVSRVVTALRDLRPDVTVLQLGNFETTVTFRQFTRRKLGLKKARANSSQTHLPPNGTFQPSSLWNLKCSVKLLADLVLGQDMPDFQALESKFSQMFDAIQAEGAGEVIVLAPLPCADPLYMRNRSRLRMIMERLSRKKQFIFLRSPLGSGDHSQYFVDATHLNALGHDAVGQAVARVISNVCRSVPRGLAVQ